MNRVQYLTFIYSYLFGAAVWLTGATKDARNNPSVAVVGGLVKPTAELELAKIWIHDCATTHERHN